MSKTAVQVGPETQKQPQTRIQTQTQTQANEYPEGGLKAWSVVLGAWCAMVPSMGLLNSLGVLHAWTAKHQLEDYSESSIGWIFGAYGFFLYLAGAQAGTHSCVYLDDMKTLNGYRTPF